MTAARYLAAAVLAAGLAVPPAPAAAGSSYTLNVHDAPSNNPQGGSWAYCVDCFGYPHVFAAAPSVANALVVGLHHDDTLTLTGQSWGTWRVCWHTGMAPRDADCGGVPSAVVRSFQVSGPDYVVWLV